MLKQLRVNKTYLSTFKMWVLESRNLFLVKTTELQQYLNASRKPWISQNEISYLETVLNKLLEVETWFVEINNESF